uniref:Signal transducer and activator of transcription n=1 Tax=Mola mola TaxID=94237 RepID=A0A3Q3XN66_MOLML
MTQWERLQQLPAAYRQQLDELYDRDALRRAARDHDLAMVLFQVLLENLDIQHSRFVQEDSFLMKHNIRRYKQNFQRYQDDPCYLASTILWFLEKEKDILQSADLAEQVQVLHIEQEAMETSSQQDLERKLAGLRNDVQCLDHAMLCLEEQQDEFDFKYQTFRMEAVTDEAVKKEQSKLFQFLINRVNECRKSTLSDLNKLLHKAKEAIDILVKNELVEWKRRQQKACIGAPDSVSLDHLENWFTCAAVCLFQVREFLSKLEELVGKVSYDKDPVKAQKPVLQRRADALLKDLLESSFVVESQPTMPQGKGPLVLRTNVQFSVKTRLLIKFPELNHAMKVNVYMDRYRRFNVLGAMTKALNMVESQNGGMVADFRHLISLSVTEELHIIYFDTVFQHKGLSVKLQASTLPVVIISNSSQQQSAWASVLWFNMISQDTKDVIFFANCPAATWPQFGEMLSWQFLAATKRGLNDAQLEMIAHKLFGKREDYNTCKVTWSKFSKENPPDTFWVWFDGIFVMVKTYLENLWRDGHIMGFVSKGKEKFLLKKKQRGTFLLRFSESVIGGITFSWVEITATGQPDVKTIQPFTKTDLSQIPFHEIIRNFLIFEVGNVPENPLLYLYPNIPKDKAFGKYSADKTGGEGIELFNAVCLDRKSALKKPSFCIFCVFLCLEQDENPLLESPLEMFPTDPMLSDSAADPGDELMMFLNNPNIFLESDSLQDEPVLSDFSLHGFNCLSPQPCGSIFQ